MSASLETSAIEEFFRKKSIFITGATGFLGKQLVEKLVRSCPGTEKSKAIIREILNCSDIEHIYLLVRPKRGQNIDERIKNLLSSSVKTFFLK